MTAIELQREIERIAERARAVDVRRFEEGAPSLVESELVPALRSLLTDAIETLTRVLAHYEASRPSDSTAAASDSADGQHFYQDIEALVAGSAGASRTADLAFMARWELERKKSALDKLNTSDVWAAIAECGSARRRLMKSATAVELALADHEDLSSSLAASYTTELNRSLETRRIYARFRHHLRSAGPFSSENAKACLRAAGTAIATVVGRTIYEDLRVSDRVELRKLQRRILDWLRGDDGFDPDSGRRLWQDLEAFGDLLLQVNNRAELSEHDAELVSELLDALRRVPSSQPISEETQRRVHRLLGRDEPVDGLIERSSQTAAGEWIPKLERLQQLLNRDGRPSDEATAVETLVGEN